MRRRIHTSWIIAWISGGILIGVILCLFTSDNFANPSWLVAGAALSFIACINRRGYMVILAIIAGILIGLSRGSHDYQAQHLYKNYLNKDVAITAVVSEDVAFGRDGKQQIKLKHIQLNNIKMNGQIWTSTYSNLDIKRSDRLELTGTVSEGFGSFAVVVNRAEITKLTKIEHADPGRELRDWFASHVRKVIVEPEASLGIGFLTGQHSTLPESLNNNLKILGLTHIVVASGYNLTILVRFARSFLARYSKYLATIGAGGLIISFILITGASPSMTRAGLITGMSLFAWYYGRRIHPLVLLPLSAALTVLYNPSYLWGDLGWYLSFAAFAGVIILAPLLVSYFWGEQKPNPLFRILTETASAQILTMPIIAFAFGQYAPLALPANLLILPFIPFVMGLVFIAGLSDILFTPASLLLSRPAQWLLDYMTFVTSKLADPSISQGSINFNFIYLILSYIFILLLIIWLWRRTKHDFNQDSIIE